KLKVIFLARDPVERAWSHLSMEVRSRQIEPFDVADIDEVIRNLRRPGMLLRSYPSAIAARWQRYVHPDLFRIYFFDDLQRDPAEFRCSILDFLGADPKKPSGRLTADYNSKAGMEKLRFTDKVRSRMAQFFKKELKVCAAKLGGPARDWPARYGFSSLFFSPVLTDSFISIFGLTGASNLGSYSCLLSPGQKIMLYALDPAIQTSRRRRPQWSRASLVRPR